MFRETSANVEEKGKIMPEISVIVPVYNVEEYLRPCIDSILEQTFTDFELILVDDGSPDRCGEICDEYEQIDKRIRVIHQENGGLSAARNAGLDVMSGEYVTFIDSDDLVDKKFLEELYDNIQNDKAQISLCQLQEFENISEIKNLYGSQPKRNVISGQQAALAVYRYASGVGVAAWGKLYRKDLFDNIRFPVGKIHEDQAIIPIVLFNAEVVSVSYEKLYFYRKVDNSIMNRTFSIQRYDDIEAVDRCISFFYKKRAFQIVCAAEKRKKLLLAMYTLQAKKQGIYKEVPKEYKMGEYRALKYLYTHLSDDRFTYQLAKVHPNWLLPHAYLRKIKKILGLKVPD